MIINSGTTIFIHLIMEGVRVNTLTVTSMIIISVRSKDLECVLGVGLFLSLYSRILGLEAINCSFRDTCLTNKCQ